MKCIYGRKQPTPDSFFMIHRPQGFMKEVARVTLPAGEEEEPGGEKNDHNIKADDAVAKFKILGQVTTVEITGTNTSLACHPRT